MANPIRLGTRASLLARTQSATVGNALSEITGRSWEEVHIRTDGDDTTTSLNQPGNPGLFVSTLRRAL
ncbi:MAG: hydroxymethylbilane synthase, partial [Actinomycetota bacterium]|nr:hydroxymethylbilane synthase [Actinomycetota bacterium]